MATIAGKSVGSTGYGLMGFMRTDPPMPFEECIATMRAALDAGANLWNAAEFYGTPDRNTLHLLHAYFTTYPSDAARVVLSVKGAMLPGTHTPDNSPANITRSLSECLRILAGTKAIDVFSCARVDPHVPIEATMHTLAPFVADARIGSIGLSEAGAGTIRRAAAIHPIAAVEVEYSLFTPDIESNGVRAACAELGIPIVAYSPLGRGYLAGRYRSAADVHPVLRKMMPRFAEENFEGNLKLAREVEGVAGRKGVRPAQLAIAWVKARSGAEGWPDVVPIPGATRVERVEENMVEVVMTEDEMKELEEIRDVMKVGGDRYPGALKDLEFA